MTQKPSAPKSDDPKTPAGDRIAKVLSRAGVASRREAERMIAEGRVAVNGAVIDSPALNVTDKDRIVVDGKPMPTAEEARLWLYYKPIGLVSTNSDEKGRTTIFDELPEDLPRVMTVGRLDINSEGLLLLTNDGGIKRKLELPETGWLRRYRVRINGRPREQDFEPLRKGLVIDGEKFQPMIVTLDRQQGANAWVTVGLREGKNREIRRAMEDIGFAVNRLLRISYGPFQLGELKPGAVEEVRRRVMRDQLGMQSEDDPVPLKPTRGRKPGQGSGQGKGKPGAARGAGPSTGAGRGTGPGRGTNAGRAAGPTGKFAGRSGKPGGVGKPGGSGRPGAGGKFSSSGKPGAAAANPGRGPAKPGARPPSGKGPARGPAKGRPSGKNPRR